MDLDTTPREKARDKAKWKSLDEQDKDRRLRLRAVEDFFEEAKAYAIPNQVQITEDVSGSLSHGWPEARLFAKGKHGIVQLRRAFAGDHDEGILVQIGDFLRCEWMFRRQSDLSFSSIKAPPASGRQSAREIGIQRVIREGGLGPRWAACEGLAKPGHLAP
jgi:hypothetical protein